MLRSGYAGSKGWMTEVRRPIRTMPVPETTVQCCTELGCEWGGEAHCGRSTKTQALAMPGGRRPDTRASGSGEPTKGSLPLRTSLSRRAARARTWLVSFHPSTSLARRAILKLVIMLPYGPRSPHGGVYTKKGERGQGTGDGKAKGEKPKAFKVLRHELCVPGWR